MIKTQVTKLEVAAYGVGDGAFALIGTLLGFYQLYFFTDVFGIDTAAVAVLMLSLRVWDTLNHPIIGLLADRSRSKYGRYRPWLLYSIAPLAVASVLSFYVPQNLSETDKIFYAVGVCFVYWTAYASANIAYIALMSAMTNEPSARGRLSAARFIGAFGASTIAMFFTKDLINFLGEGSESSGYFKVSLLYASLASVALLVTFRLTKERVTEVPSLTASFGKDITELSKLKPLWLLLLAGFCTGIFVTVKSSTTLFYLKYVVQMPTMDKFFMAGGTVSCLVGVCAIAFFINRYEKKTIFLLLMSGASICMGSIYWIDNLALLFLFHFLNSLLGGACAPVFFAIYADLVDLHEYKTGSRAAALINSLGLFAGSLGAAVGGFLGPAGLAWTGYEANSAQSALAVEGITLLFTLIPSLFAAGAVVAMIFYRFTRIQLAHVSDELDARRYAVNG